jgi:hypothetical protein
MRSHAFGCLVSISKKIPSLFKILIDLLEKNLNNVSLRTSMVNIWSEKYFESGVGTTSHVAVYRSQELEFASLRNRIYSILCSDTCLTDFKFRFSVFRLYQCIWGYHEKPSLADSSSFNSKRRSKYRVEMKSKRDLKKRKVSNLKQDASASVEDMKAVDKPTSVVAEEAKETNDIAINEI